MAERLINVAAVLPVVSRRGNSNPPRFSGDAQNVAGISNHLKSAPVPARLNAMGRTYHFQCSQCRYHVNVSGGVDSGLNCDVQTIHCHDCRELFDVFTRVRREIGTKERARKFPAFAQTEIPPVILRDSQFAEKPVTPRQFEWQKLKPACPVAEKHFIELWKQPGRCPRCHAFMSPEGAAFRAWE